MPAPLEGSQLKGHITRPQRTPGIWWIHGSYPYHLPMTHTDTRQWCEDAWISFRYSIHTFWLLWFGASRMAHLLIARSSRRGARKEDGETGWHCLLPEPLLTAGEGQPWQKAKKEADGREGKISGGTSPLQESRSAKANQKSCLFFRITWLFIIQRHRGSDKRMCILATMSCMLD